MAPRELSNEVTGRPASVASRNRDVRDVRRASGPAAAVVLAVGIACFALGLLSVASAASGSVADALAVSERTGEAAGLSIVTGLVFFASWAGLLATWRRADPPLARVALVSAALVALGLVGTFPPVFNAF